MNSSKDESLIRNLIRYVLRRKKFLVYFCILLVILCYAVFGKKGIIQRVDLELENRKLQKKLNDEQAKTVSLQKETEEIKTSDKKIETVAREKYGMVKDGEEIYKVMRDSTK